MKRSLSVVALVALMFILYTGCGGKEVSETPPMSEPTGTQPVKPTNKIESDITEAIESNAEAVLEDLARLGHVDTESVLNVIPGDAIGVIYVHSLTNINQEINDMLAALVPNEPPQDIIAKVLADAFHAGFESLEELEELGLDMGKNFAIFFSSLNPPVMSAAVHMKDPESVKQLIDTQSEGSIAATHKGITYYATGEGSAFVLMEDVMVYSSAVETCQASIDTFKRAKPSISLQPNYSTLSIDTTSGVNDIVAYLEMESVAPMLKEALEGIKANMSADVSTNPELASGLAMSHNILDGIISLVDQAKILDVTLQLNGTDLQVSPYIKFKPGSDLQKAIQAMPKALTQLEYLPQTAAINGAMRVRKEDVTWFDTSLKLLLRVDPNADQAEIDNAMRAYEEATQALWAPFGEEIAFSMNFNTSMMPDMFFMADVVDKAEAKKQIDNYLTYLQTTQALYEAMGVAQSANVFGGTYVGAPEQYKGVEIKRYVMPNFGMSLQQLPASMQSLAPQEWSAFFALKGEKMVTAIGADAQGIKAVLDRIDGTGTGFNQTEGYGKITKALSLENNMMLAISPITAAKSIITLVSQVEPNAAMMMMLLGNIPETYSIGVASQNRDGGVEGKLFISLSDFKELINMAISMQQMQGMERM